MNKLTGALFKNTPAPLIRAVPFVPFLRGVFTFILNQKCAKYGTSLRFSGNTLQIRRGTHVMRVSSANWIYGPTLSKDFDSFFNSVEPTREGELEIVDYSRQGLQKFRKCGLEFETSGFPEDESVVLDYFKWYEPKPGDLVFDLGANCGLSVYYLSERAGPGGKVIAFEPDPINFAILNRNILRHKLTNVVSVQKAISGESGVMKFHSEGTIGSTLASQSSHPNIGTVETVQVLSLTDACSQFGVPSFIKMDIEGAEIEAISGSMELLSGTAINLAIDTCHVRDGMLTAQPVEDLLKQCGYVTTSSDESGAMTTWAKKQSP